jgi:cytochrome P450
MSVIVTYGNIPPPLAYKSMLRDEIVYPHPETFDPDRFMQDGKLNPDVRDPSLRTIFGFGRRADSLWNYIHNC